MKNFIKTVAIIAMIVCMVNLVFANSSLTEKQKEIVNEFMLAVTTSTEEKVAIKGMESFDEASLIREYISKTYFSGKSFTYSSSYYYENGVKLVKITIKPATVKAQYEKYCSQEFIPLAKEEVTPEPEQPVVTPIEPEKPTLSANVQAIVDDIMTTGLTKTGKKVRVNDIYSISDFKEARTYIKNTYFGGNGTIGYTAMQNSITGMIELYINADQVRANYNQYKSAEYVIENYIDAKYLPYVEEIMTKILTSKTDAALISEFDTWEDWDIVKEYVNKNYFNKSGINYLSASVNRNTGKILVRINAPMSKANYIGGYTINEKYIDKGALNSTETYTIRNSFEKETVAAKEYKTLYILLTNYLFKGNNETINFEYSQNTYYKTHKTHYVKFTVNGKATKVLVANDQVWNKTMNLIKENYFKFSDKNVVISGTSTNVSSGTVKGTIQVAKTRVNQAESEANKKLIIALAESFDLTGNKVADLITINNYLSNRDNYAYNSDIGSITKFLNDKTGNCYCYTKVMELVCEYIGIEVDMVSGEMINGTAHTWNSVVVDGNTYYMDLTWNRGHTYWFLMDRTTFEIDHIFN